LWREGGRKELRERREEKVGKRAKFRSSALKMKRENIKRIEAGTNAVSQESRYVTISRWDSPIHENSLSANKYTNKQTKNKQRI
jgi:hypothetical protein